VRAEAIAALVRIEAGAWSDRLLASREALLADRRDRAFFHHLVLSTLRWQGALDRALSPFSRRPLGALDAPLRAALRLGLAQGLLFDRPAPVAVSTTVDGLRRAGAERGAGLVNAVLRRALESPEPLDVRATLPAWLVERWSERFGDEACAELARVLATPPRPFLVASPSSGGRARLAERLKDEGIEAEPSTLHPQGLRVLAGVPQESRAFSEGAFVLLDAGAAAVALLAGRAAEGLRVDLAAAPGGKAALLAHSGTGPLVALEPVRSRARDLARNLRRAGGRAPVQALRADARRPPLPAGSVDLALLDAPCSGTGTLRRRPERRHRLRPEDVRRAVRLQDELLDAAAALLRPGGHLVYAVCSLEPEEGRERVAALTQRRPDLVFEDPAAQLGPEFARFVEGDPPLLALRPDRVDAEGFVAARLRRLL
jgi:16S rRNA (cytosine967-C5)-methyltransferase